MQARIQKALAKRQAGEGGFTLIELLVVIVIIGILAAIAIPAFLNQREKAWVKAVESDLRNLAMQIETDGVDASGAFKDDLITGIVDAFEETAGVTVAKGTVTAQDFIISGYHANIDDGRGSSGEAIEYNSAEGGLQTD